MAKKFLLIVALLFFVIILGRCGQPPTDQHSGITNPTSPTSLRWPLDGAVTDGNIASGFKFGSDWNCATCDYCGGIPKKHTGIDLNYSDGFKAKAGDPVYAAESGTVEKFNPGTNLGEALVILHNGFLTNYTHINILSNITSTVIKGQQIGTIFDLGKDTHLHFGIWVGPYSRCSHRGALPQISPGGTGNNSCTDTTCTNDPLFSGNFIDPWLIYESLLRQNQTYVISGTVTLGGIGLAGVAITLTSSGSTSVTTDANGNFIFSGLQIGSYTVTPSLTGYTFTPPSISVTVNNANVTGQNFTATQSIPPPCAVPTVATGSATNIALNSATLLGTVNPNGSSTEVYSQYGTNTASYGNSYSQNVGSGTSNLNISVNLAGLSPNTTYYYRIVATNSCGTAFGADQIFTTLNSEVIIDDQSPGFSRFGPSQYWNETFTGYNGHMYYTQNTQNQISNYAIWQPTLPGAGTYAVYVYIPSSNYANSTNAIYTVYHNGVTDGHVINQSQYYDQWVLLGTFYFIADGSEFARLNDLTGEASLSRYVGFDAIKWVKQ